jgi:hypothetical protein
MVGMTGMLRWAEAWLDNVPGAKLDRLSLGPSGCHVTSGRNISYLTFDCAKS